MAMLPILFCTPCAEQLFVGKPVVVQLDTDIDFPGAALCPHELARYRALAPPLDQFAPCGERLERGVEHPSSCYYCNLPHKD